MSQETKSILKRLLKGFVSGAVTVMLGITAIAPKNWTEMSSFLNVLLLAGVFGGVNGALLALEKWYNWKE